MKGAQDLPASWREWVSPSGFFAAGIFCWVLAVSLGAKLLAAGQIFMLVALISELVRTRGAAFSWRSLPPSAWCLAAFVVVAVLSIVFNRALIASPWEHLGKIKHVLLVLGLLAMPGLAKKPLGEAWRRDALVLAWIVPLLLVVLIGLVGVITGHHPFRGDDVISARRLTGIYGQVMTFAYSLQFSVLALGSFVLAPRLWKGITRVPWWALLIAAAAAAGALYLTYTRGAMLGAVAGVATYGVMRSWKIAAVIVVVGLLIGVAARLEGARYFDGKSDNRVSQWRAASLAFLERPVLGWGFWNFEPHSAELKKRYGFEKDLIRKRGQKPVWEHFQGHAHNNFLETFASTGFAGGLAFLAFSLSWWKEAKRSRYRLFFLPAVMAFLVSGCFENTFFDAEVLNCLMLLYLFNHWTREEFLTGPASGSV